MDRSMLYSVGGMCTTRRTERWVELRRHQRFHEIDLIAQVWRVAQLPSRSFA